MKKFLLLLAFLTGVTGFGQTVNPTYSPAQFFANPPAILAIRLSQVGVQFPSWQPKTIYIGTNSSVTFSNVPTGYSYGVDFIQNFWTPPTSWTNTFPANISGTVNATNWIFYTQTFQGPPYYPSGSTNGGTPLLSGTNTFVDNLNGSNRVNVPFGIFDANGSAAAVQSYLSSICMTNNDTRQFTFSGGGWQFSGPAFQIGNTGSGIFWYGTYLTTVGAAYFSGNGSGLTNIPAAAIVGLSSGALTNVVVNTLNGLTSSVSISGSTATINVGTSNQFTVANAATLASALQSVPVGATNLFTTTNAVLSILATSGAVTNAPWQQVAQTFNIANNIYDPQLQQVAIGWCREQNEGGFWNNVVDHVFLDPRLGTNITTLMLRPIGQGAGVKYLPVLGLWSTSSSAGGIWVSNLPPLQNSNTIAVTWKAPLNERDGDGSEAAFGGGFIAGLFDTNNATGQFIELNQGPAACFYNGTISNCAVASSMPNSTNTSAPFVYYTYWNKTYYQATQNPYNTVQSWNSNGVVTYYETGVKSGFNNSGTVTNCNFNVAGTTFPPLTVLRVMNSYNNIMTPQYTMHGTISGVTVYNCSVDPTLETGNPLVTASFYADQEVLPDTIRNIWIGDSLWSYIDHNTSPNGGHYGDSPAYLASLSFGFPNKYAWWNYAYASQQLTSYTDARSTYRLNVLMAPHGRVTQTKVWNEAGSSVNSFFTYALTSSNMINLATNYLNTCTSNNETLYVTTADTVWSNNATANVFTLTAETNRLAFNSWLHTNQFNFAGVIDEALVSSQGVLNTNNNLSSDGIHCDVIPSGLWRNPVVMQKAAMQINPPVSTFSTTPLY